MNKSITLSILHYHCIGDTSSLLTSENDTTNATNLDSLFNEGSGADERFTVSALLQVRAHERGIQLSDAGQYECVAGFDPQAGVVSSITVNVTVTGEIIVHVHYVGTLYVKHV